MLTFASDRIRHRRFQPQRHSTWLRHLGEILGTTGTLRIGYLRETPLFVMTKNRVAHDPVPFFMERRFRSNT